MVGRICLCQSRIDREKKFSKSTTDSVPLLFISEFANRFSLKNESKRNFRNPQKKPPFILERWLRLRFHHSCDLLQRTGGIPFLLKACELSSTKK